MWLCGRGYKGAKIQVKKNISRVKENRGNRKKSKRT
jgi:hypothetical protein